MFAKGLTSFSSGVITSALRKAGYIVKVLPRDITTKEGDIVTLYDLEFNKSPFPTTEDK